ncbi:MAG: hypothetical protein ACTSWW_10700 [Promethearchaeota archaeon]
MHEVSVGPAALEYITKTATASQLDEYVVIMADTHCCGGMLSVEVKSLSQMQHDQHMQELFPQGYKDFSFGLWVERQALREDAFPEHILIDLKHTSRGQELEVKNGRFETLYPL